VKLQLGQFSEIDHKSCIRQRHLTARIQGREATIERDGQRLTQTGWCTNIHGRASALIGSGAVAVLKEGFLTRKRTDDLIPKVRLPGTGHNDRTRADDLSFRKRPFESRKGRSLGTGETQAAVALGIGTIGTVAQASVNRTVSIRGQDRLRHTVSADHVPIANARGINRADILTVAQMKREADAVTQQHVARAVVDSVENATLRRSAKRVSLILTNHESSARRTGRGRWVLRVRDFVGRDLCERQPRSHQSEGQDPPQRPHFDFSIFQ